MCGPREETPSPIESSESRTRTELCIGKGKKYLAIIASKDPNQLSSYEACGTISRMTREIKGNFLALFTSNMEHLTKEVDPNDRITYWHAATLVRKERHCYVYSSFFDPSHFTSMEGIEISSQISSQKWLSLIATTIGWIKHSKSAYSGIRGKTKGGIKGAGMRVYGIWTQGVGIKKSHRIYWVSGNESGKNQLRRPIRK